MTALALVFGVFPLKSMAMENKVVSMQEVEFQNNECKYENCIVSAEDEKNFIEKLSSKLLRYFSAIKINDNSFLVNPEKDAFQINYEMEYTCITFDEIEEKCNNPDEAKKYLLRQIFDLALDFYFNRPDLMGPMASEEDLKNFNIVKKWYNQKIDGEKFGLVLSTIGLDSCKFSSDVEQIIHAVFRYS